MFSSCSTLSKFRELDINEKSIERSKTLQQVENIIDPTPLQIQYTDPHTGGMTTISTPPKSKTKYSITDDTDLESDFEGREISKFYSGISPFLIGSLFLISLILFFKLTAAGKVSDKIIGGGLNKINDLLAESEDSKEREKLLHIKNLLDRKH